MVSNTAECYKEERRREGRKEEGRKGRKEQQEEE